VSPDLTFLILFVVVVVWTLLPLLPMFFELYRRTDVAPLAVPAHFEGDTPHFARRFRAYIDHQLEEMPAPLPTDKRRHLPDGTPVYVVDEATPFKSEYPEKRVPATPPRVTVTAVPVTIPAKTSALREVYAERWMEAGDSCVFRSVFGEESVDLGEKTCVLRWVHAADVLHAGADSQLYGRASAGDRLEIDEGCRFERLFAPEIRFGAGAARGRQRDTSSLRKLEPDLPPLPSTPVHRAGENGVDRRLPLRIVGDYQLPPRTLLERDLVVSGELRVGEGCVAKGSLKGTNGIALGEDVVVGGSVVTEGNLWLKAGCTVRGPLIAERDVFIERDCCIGAGGVQTTVTSARIYIEPGVTVHGTVWAREVGLVAALS